ncbi:hypothetical protein BGZ54_009066 [Gamsiella multidivaricata]|nr:hypothetical protein BGZ54_009066 [Gamsiella multidivaricata]
MIWAFAGIVCTIGAFAYAELGTMFPESGGDFQYLSRAYGKKVARVFGWSFITILNPIGTAGIAGVLGRYAVDMIAYLKSGGATVVAVNAINETLGGAGYSVLNGTGYDIPRIHSPYAPGTPAYDAFPKEPLPRDHTGAVLPNVPHAEEMPWVVRAFAIGAILVMGLINIFFREGGKYASNILAVFKIAGMCMLIVIGSVQAAKHHAQSEALSIPIEESSHNVLDYVSALCFAFFAYNGFNNINLGLGELRDPERNLKRAVWIAMPFVTVLFLLANFAFFSILSSYDLRHVHSLSLQAGHTVLGKPGGFLMAGTVIASALGSINANIWAGSRLLVIMAKDNSVIPFPIGRQWARTGTQAIAILVLIGQASIHALINLDFKTFSKIYSAVGWSWYGLSILGLLYLRKKKPSYPRPVKVFWPLAVFFVMVAFFLVFGSLTLAFISTNPHKQSDAGGGAENGGGAGEEDGAKRYTSVIMFSMAVLFVLGVVPAFYLTRCYNRRRQARKGTEDNDDSIIGHEGANNTSSSLENDIDEVEPHDGLASRYLEPKSALEINSKDDKPERRDSSASSITLVDESKKGGRRGRRQHRSGDPQEQQQGQPDASRSHNRHCDDDGDEEETNRIQALRSNRLSAQSDSMEKVELGAYMASNSAYDFSPDSEPSTPAGAIFISSTTTSPRSGFSTPTPFNSPYGPYLSIPCIQQSSSRSSEITLGFESEYVYEKEQEGKSSRSEYEGEVLQEEHSQQQQVDKRSMEVLDQSRAFYLDVPLTDNDSSTSSSSASTVNNSPVIRGQNPADDG